MLIQAGFALVFLIVALALHDDAGRRRLRTPARRSTTCCVVGTLAYAASYFARGWLAGHERFGLFGGLVLMESVSRVCFALAVAIGIASGQTAVALGIAAAPFVSLVVVPVAFARTRPSERSGRGAGAARGGAGRAITVDEADAALAGPGTEGVQETRRARRALAAPRRRLRGLGLGDHALRADAAERRRADRRRDLAATARSPGSSSTCC